MSCRIRSVPGLYVQGLTGTSISCLFSRLQLRFENPIHTQGLHIIFGKVLSFGSVHQFEMVSTEYRPHDTDHRSAVFPIQYSGRGI